MTSFPKTPSVRLKGTDLQMLRLECLQRDRGRCVRCGVHVISTDWIDDCHPLKYDMSHIRSKHIGGDVLSNVETTCHQCHMRGHTEGRDAS